MELAWKDIYDDNVYRLYIENDKPNFNQYAAYIKKSRNGRYEAYCYISGKYLIMPKTIIILEQAKEWLEGYIISLCFKPKTLKQNPAVEQIHKDKEFEELLKDSENSEDACKILQDKLRDTGLSETFINGYCIRFTLKQK